MMRKKIGTLVATVLAGIGTILIVFGVFSAIWHDDQSDTFNIGLDQFAAQDFKAAQASFQAVIAMCQKTQTEVEKSLVPPPKTETCAQAEFQLGKTYIALQQYRKAAQSFQNAIRHLTTLTAQQPDREDLRRQTKFAQYDYLLLRQSHSSDSQPMPGDGQPADANGQQPGQQGNAPAQVPSNLPGQQGTGSGSGSSSGQHGM